MRTRAQKRFLDAVIWKKKKLARGTTAPTYHLHFDGVDDKIVIPAGAAMNNLPKTNFTIEMGGTFSEKITSLCNTVDALYSNGIDLYIYPPSDELYLEMYSSGNYYGVQFPFTSWGTPHHFEVTWDKDTSTVKFFLDGVEQSSSGSSNNDGFSVEDLDDILNDIYIAAHSQEAGNNLQGDLTWFRVSNIARHTSNFTPPSLTICPHADMNTVLRLALDTGTGTSAADTSGNSNNGTITGASWEED